MVEGAVLEIGGKVVGTKFIGESIQHHKPMLVGAAAIVCCAIQDRTLLKLGSPLLWNKKKHKRKKFFI